MKTYLLTDDHGQPLRFFNRERNTTKAVAQLSGICAGILADGVVTEQEVLFFADWIRQHAPAEPVWPLTDILARVERIFADGHCDDEEREELKSVMQALCGAAAEAAPAQTLATTLPLDAPPPEVLFAAKKFAVTGKFAHGSRRQVLESIAARGGEASALPPTRETDYLLIGVFASRDWATATYGRKIEKAVELRAAGVPLAIISEEHWKKFLP